MDSWTDEDLTVWESLKSAGYVEQGEAPSLLSAVNGARRLERARLLQNLHTLPEDEQLAIRHIITWIMIGAPDYDPRRGS